MQAPAIQDLLEKILKVKVRSIRWDQPVHDKNTPLRSLIDQRAVSCDVATAAPIAWKSIDAAVMAPFASMQVFVNSSSGNTRSIDINENELVLDLKREIQVIKGFPPGQQRLMYDDNVLDNDYSLHSQEVENGSTVQLILIQCGC
ncbi:ubiquitin-related domain-containing protein [Obelidium mucronatum]|nr:ubiquitin-related domain-containing protein [Obelidium mucronatum]